MPALRQCDLSVIVPVYNLENFLAPLLDSLERQKTEYTVEYIFVLNNCTDRSEDVIRSSKLDARIINCDIQGCGPARNAGLNIATGEYIWFMDGDDWLTSDTAIQDVLYLAKTEDLDILRIPFESDYFMYEYFSMVWQYLLRREFVDGIRFPNYQPAEDDAYMYNVLALAGYSRQSYLQLPCINKSLYFYNYMREGSNMQRYINGERI